MMTAVWVLGYVAVGLVVSGTWMALYDRRFRNFEENKAASVTVVAFWPVALFIGALNVVVTLIYKAAIRIGDAVLGTLEKRKGGKG